MQLAGIVQQLAVIDPAQAAALIERTLAVAKTILSNWLRSDALASIAERLAGAASESAVLPPQERGDHACTQASHAGLVSRSRRALGQEPPGNPDITHDRRNDQTLSSTRWRS
jgi:hypothetical protein